MKKYSLAIIIFLILLMSTGCLDREIILISREEGSGTRDAFVNLIGLIEKTESSKKDLTSKETIIQMQTETVIKSVEGNKDSIGYISLNSLSDRVKALKINGVYPGEENILDASYKISRYLYLVTKEEDPLIDDFLSFVASKPGQEKIKSYHIPLVREPEDYNSQGLEGRLTISGSTSLGPVVEALALDYMEVNPKIKVEIQQNGSSTGLTNLMEGNSQIAMSSRDLSPEETASLTDHKIALDGIAIIVNKDNPIDSLSEGDLKEIYTGKIRNWRELELEE